MWRNWKPSALLIRLRNGVTTMENGMEGPQKTKYRITIQSSNPTRGHISRQKYNSERFLYPYVHCSTIHDNSHDMEAT